MTVRVEIDDRLATVTITDRSIFTQTLIPPLMGI
jgi:hypothetical protein